MNVVASPIEMRAFVPEAGGYRLVKAFPGCLRNSPQDIEF